MRKKLLILGSTGSIGSRALDVVRDFSGDFEVCGLSTFGRVELLEKQIREFRPVAFNVSSPRMAGPARKLAEAAGVALTLGGEGLSRLIPICEPDVVLVSTVGIAGLGPTMTAIEYGCDVALANKEVLVAGGDLVMKAARRNDARVIPIDSEHNAIAQCLMGQAHSALKKIILTASGGPFCDASREELEKVTVEEALNHPTWNMGPKITIDSATLMNKGFEAIEAHHLFSCPMNRIEVAVHPQSVIHSLTEFIDGSILAQLSVTDMYLTIQSALFFPERRANKLEPLDLMETGTLTFRRPDAERFPCLKYAFEAAQEGGTAPAVLNAANEVAVRRFLNQEIGFTDIPRIIRECMDACGTKPDPDLQTIFQSDEQARKAASLL